MKKKLILLVCFFFFIVTVLAIEYRTTYNPFTGKLDFIRGGNWSGENITADWFLGKINYSDVQNHPVIGGMDYTNVAMTNVSEIWDNGLNITMGNGGWFKGLFNWTTLTNWLFFDGSILSLNETKLNNAIDSRSLNQTEADLIYLNLSGTNVNQNIDISPYNLSTSGWMLPSNFRAITYYSTGSNLPFNFYDDGSELFLNFSGENFNLEGENSKVILFNEPNVANDFKVFQVFSKEASDVTEFVITKAKDEFASYFIRSLSLPGNSTDTPTPHNCSTYANFIDCKTDVTGPDLFVLDDIELGGTIYVGEAVRANDWTNVSITESQISNLVHTTNSTVQDISLNQTEADNIYLNLSGTNANQNIDISPYNLTLGDKITFGFAEIIDNLVDGWIRITGGLNVTENLNVIGNVTIGGDITTIGIGTFSSLNATGNIYSNSYQVLSYQRTVNVKNVTMTVVI